MRLDGRVAIVTGAASGIGFAIAEKFMWEGANVLFADVNEDVNLAPYGDKASFCRCDVSKREDVENLVKAAVERFGKLDIMVNNAGIGSTGGILELTDEGWEKTLAVNLTGVMYGVRAAAEHMKTHGVCGSIINISSILGTVGFLGAVAYCAAKGGVVQLTRSSALDLAQYSIRVNAIAPGFIRTNMTQDVLNNEDFLKMIEANTPLGYVSNPEDIAHGAVYLASDESKYVTGEILHIDGGWRAR